ncbi:MAG: MarR family transcriptional regulator [Bacillota bacterium]|nr:MarR family transcriptional regulator [Bacillota bacterium]
MKAVTGREIVVELMELGAVIGHWNKKYSTKENLTRKLDELGLTVHQVELMGFMRSNPELNTVSQLSHELFISKGSLSLMLTKLQAAGFVQKTAPAGADDGRKVYLALTEKGAEAVEDVRNTMLDSASGVFDEMDGKRRQMFYAKVMELKELFDIGGWKE